MRIIPVLTLLTLVGSAAGEQFWVEYDATCGQFPEQVGWERQTYYGGDQHSFDGGSLVLDGLAPDGPEDYYRMDAPIALGPGETFVMQWRMRVDQVIGPYFDPGVNFTVLGQAALTLVYSESSIFSLGESTIATFEPGVFHNYQVTSSDLDTYTLQIDGQEAHSGLLAPTGWESGMEWGDYTRPVSSLSMWDSVSFGVVPEPGALALLGCAGLVFRGRTQR
jgi:hypothetical protein